MDCNSKKIGHVIPHTHWDREWRYPVWKNRMLLINFMDELLDIFDNDPDYKFFLMDGQCVTIEDYLEVRPEKKDKISQYASEGRLGIGPWYTLPDLYPIDGECLVRNLLRGIRYSQNLGKCLNIGYTTFGWGQIAQFPQIYKGFDMDFIVTAKHISKERAPLSEFLWESPDGTQVLTTRLGNATRSNFLKNVYIPVRCGVNYYSNDDYKYDWEKGDLLYHDAIVQNSFQDYFVIDYKERYYPDKLKDGVLKAWHDTDATILEDHRLIMSGLDFVRPQPDLTKIIKDANEILEGEMLVHSTLDEYEKKLQEFVDKSKLIVIRGELRDGPANICTGNALSTRSYVKRLNRKAQNILMRKAEPFAAALSIEGVEYPASFFDIAWKNMLHSHAHDSINGVTQDKTVDDVTNRLEQAVEIGKVIYEKSIMELIKKIDLSKHNEGEVIMVAVNSSPHPSRDVLKVCVDIPQDRNVWEFVIIDTEKNISEVQYVSREERSLLISDERIRSWAASVDRHTVYIDTGMVPAGGYKVFIVVPISNFDRSIIFWPPMRKSQGGDISKENVLENEFLKVVVNGNGSFNLFDKTQNKEFKNLHYFEDTGDVGDYWVYYPPYHNKTYTSLGCKADIWVEDNGALSATIGIEVEMSVPEYGIRHEKGVSGESRRSDEKTTLSAITYLTLKKNSKRVDIKTKINNTARDHRFSVLFPTGIKAEYAYAAGHFNVDKRPVVRAIDDKGTYYPEMQTLPQQSFVDVNNGKTGFAVINSGLNEYEVRTDENNTLALTYFRSVRNIIATEMRMAARFPYQHGGQCLGNQEFEYSIFTHEGKWEQSGIYKEAVQFNAPMDIIQTKPHKLGTLPQAASLFSVEPDNLVLSTFKKAEDRDSYIMRFFNPTDNELEGALKVFRSIKAAYFTNLNEKRLSQIKLVDKHTISLKAAKHKIITIELEF